MRIKYPSSFKTRLLGLYPDNKDLVNKLSAGLPIRSFMEQIHDQGVNEDDVVKMMEEVCDGDRHLMTEAFLLHKIVCRCIDAQLRKQLYSEYMELHLNSLERVEDGKLTAV